MAEDRIDHVEHENVASAIVAAGGDKAAAVIQESGRTVTLNYENNKRVLRKIDLHILPVILAIYFLQALDKVRETAGRPNVSD